MKKHKIFLLLSMVLVMIYIPQSTYGATENITRIIFTNDALITDPGVLSGAITVQTQNISREEEKLDTTADVNFTSSSGTGEFLGSTGKSVTKIMNSGSANKTFYYKDSTVGMHTITITVTPRNGDTQWTTSQIVYVGVEINNKNEISNSLSNTQTGDSHSSTKKTTSYTKVSNLKIGAGRNRTVLLNSPIYFAAENNQQDSKIKLGIDCTWSFGDGDNSNGCNTNHVYYFAGDYNVVLTARYKKEEIVSRIKVKVIDNLVRIIDNVSGVNGYIELYNDSDSEINIGGWKLNNNGKEYLIAQDTIIDSKDSIRISNRITHFQSEDYVQIIFPTDEIASTYVQKVIQEEKETLPPQIFVVGKPDLSKEEDIRFSKYNYATTVQAAATLLPDITWWSYIKSFFSVE